MERRDKKKSNDGFVIEDDGTIVRTPDLERKEKLLGKSGAIVQWFKNNDIIYNIDEDGDFYFKYQQHNFYILNQGDDKLFLHVILPNIWSIDNEDERADVLIVANELNTECKVLKAFVTSNDIILSVEMFMDSTPNVEDYMKRILDILISGRELFSQKMHELQ